MPNDSRDWPTRALAGPRTSGEHATGAILGALPVGEWTVFEQVRVGGRRTPLQVAVGPQGVFVVESRRRSRLSARDEVRPHGVRQDVVVAASGSAAAVAALTGLVEPRHVRPVVCYVGHEIAPVVAGDVVVCSTRSLLAILTSGPAVLDPDQRQLVALDLDTSIGASPRSAPSRATGKRRWLRVQLFGAVLACLGSLGLWQVAAVAGGPAGPTDALSAVVR